MSMILAVLLTVLVAAQVTTRLAQDKFKGFKGLPNTVPGS